jgi:hypothetical protein
MGIIVAVLYLRMTRKISCSHHVKEEEELLQRVEAEGNTQHKIKRRKANWIGHI